MIQKAIAGGAFALLAATLATAGDKNDKPYQVMVGDAAPALTVGEWVKGEPIASLASDGTYVVEFWATWCGPCKKAIPHMSELQKEYADVKFVGVSVWESDQTKVAPFVKDMGDRMAYSVAMDKMFESTDDYGKKKDKGRMAEGWMTAAGQRGIPAAFIVDDGKIAWIGSPFEIDEPLKKVVAGEWDLAAATAEHTERMAITAYISDVEKRIKTAKKAGNWAETVTVIDEAVAKHADLEGQFGVQKFVGLLHSDAAQSSVYGNQIVANLYKDNAGALNWIAWSLVDPESEVEKPDLELAISAGKRACELSEWEDPAILDTLALAFYLSGDKEKAIKIQTKAVEHSAGTPYEDELKSRLDEYKKEAGVAG